MSQEARRAVLRWRAAHAWCEGGAPRRPTKSSLRAEKRSGLKVAGPPVGGVAGAAPEATGAARRRAEPRASGSEAPARRSAGASGEQPKRPGCATQRGAGARHLDATRGRQRAAAAAVGGEHGAVVRSVMLRGRVQSARQLVARGERQTGAATGAVWARIDRKARTRHGSDTLRRRRTRDTLQDAGRARLAMPRWQKKRGTSPARLASPQRVTQAASAPAGDARAARVLASTARTAAAPSSGLFGFIFKGRP
jgi:hypothetical protein